MAGKRGTKGSVARVSRDRVTGLAGVALAGIVLCTLALATPVGASESSDSIAELEHRIGELKQRAQFGDAAELARQLLLRKEENPTAEPFELVDAQWRLSTLEVAAGLPQDAQREFARIDSLQAVVDRSWDDGRYKVGMAAAERRLEILRTYLGPEHPEVARSLDDVGGFLEELGESGRGEELCAEAFAMRQRLLGDKHPLMAESTNNLAHFARVRGDYHEAVRLGSQAVEMYRDLLDGEHPDLPTALGNLALYLQLGGDVSAAEPLFRESIAVGRRLLGADHPNVATSLDNLAVLLMDKGDHAAAEPLYREALAMRRRTLGDEHPYLSIGLNNLGVLLLEQGDYDGAEALFLEVLAMRQKLLGDDHHLVAMTLNNLGTVYSDRGDYAAAERLYREALERLTTLLGRGHPRTGLCIHNLACAVGDHGDYAGAEELFLEALAIRRDVFGEEHPDVAATLRNLAQIIVDGGDYGRAEPIYRQALDTYRRTLGEGHRGVVRCLRGYGELLLAQGDYAAAESILTEAVRAYDAARLRAGTGYTRATFLTSPYEALAGVRLLLSNEDEAWPAAERALGRSLADLLMAAEQRGLSSSERAREDSLKKTLGDLERELSVYRAAARSDTTGDVGARVEGARNQLLAAEAEWSIFQREISATHPVTEGEAFSLERVQASLSEETALVGWLDAELPGTEGHAWAYAVRRSGPVTWVRLAPTAGKLSAFDRSRGVRQSLADPGTPELAMIREVSDFWAERVEPLKPALDGVEELVIIPSGAMLGVPVEALIDREGTALGERYAVSYAPSATIHTWLAERGAGSGARAAGSALLVGDPPFAESQLAAVAGDAEGKQTEIVLRGPMPEAETIRSALSGNKEALASLPRLAGTREEVLTIAELFPDATVLLGSEASERLLVEMAETGALGGFETIHLATHALVDDDQPGRSALILSQVELPDPLEAAIGGARIYDGLVTAEEVVREWELDADLVTLSACETGLGKAVGGEGYIGFAHAFLQAGARSLLVSLWKVEDRATALLMRRFYENHSGAYEGERAGYAAGPMAKAQALQEAKRWLRTYTDHSGHRPYKHPYYWSAFILVGDPG